MVVAGKYRGSVRGDRGCHLVCDGDLGDLLLSEISRGVHDMFRVSRRGKDDHAVLRGGMGQVIIVEGPALVRKVNDLQPQRQESSRHVGTEACHQLTSRNVDRPGLPDNCHRGEDIL